MLYYKKRFIPPKADSMATPEVLMDLIAKVFETKRNIQLLHLCSRLNLPPTSETNTLLLIYDLSSRQNGTGTSVSELAGLLNVSVPTVSRCLQKLSEKGYIQKTANEKDKRGTYVSLSPEGAALCQEAHDTINSFLARVIARLDPSELEQFVAMMDKIYAAVRDELSGEAQ